jgi:hypothetical protein
MGDISLLASDPYSQTRGVLPRLLEDAFHLASATPHSSFKLTCSYIEIYNEQIFDLVPIHLLSSPRTKGFTKSEKTPEKASSWKASSRGS